MQKYKILFFVLITLLGANTVISQTIGPVRIPYPLSAYGEEMQGYLGNGGFTAYCTVCRYSVIAVDKDKILAAIPPLHGIATFDGGNTWKGIDGKPEKTKIHGDTLPEALTSYPFEQVIDGYCHNTQNVIYQASHINNDLFVGGMFQCNGANYDAPIWFRRIKYNGQYWVKDPHYMVDNKVTKCISGGAVELPSGRIWFIWANDIRYSGFGMGLHAKYSDDNGVTWNLVNGKRVVSEYNRGYSNSPYLAVPYLNGVAVVWTGDKGLGWSYNLTGSSWSNFEVIIPGFNANNLLVKGDNYNTIFVCMSKAERSGEIKVAVRKGDKWQIENVGDSNIEKVITGSEGGDPYLGGLWPTVLDGRAALTACGEDIYCLWADKSDNGYHIFLKKRLGDNNWSDAKEIVFQKERIYQLAVPIKSPEGWIPFFWDCFDDNAGPPDQDGGLRFMNYHLSSTGILDERKSCSSISEIKVFPNPFNTSAQIFFTLNKKSHVELSLYNILGELVDILVDEELSAGRHSKISNAEKLASGIYIYVIKTKDVIQTKKCIILR